MKRTVFLIANIILSSFLFYQCEKELELGDCSVSCAGTCTYGYIGTAAYLSLQDCKNYFNNVRKNHPNCDCDYNWYPY
jgi:hypothetical protein